jgi:hypothetical protein
MQNVNNDGVGKMVFWQQRSECRVQIYTEFPVRTVYHRHTYGEFSAAMVSIRITSKGYITSYPEITPTVHDLVNGCNHGYTF